LGSGQWGEFLNPIEYFLINSTSNFEVERVFYQSGSARFPYVLGAERAVITMSVGVAKRSPDKKKKPTTQTNKAIKGREENKPQTLPTLNLQKKEKNGARTSAAEKTRERHRVLARRNRSSGTPRKTEDNLCRSQLPSGVEQDRRNTGA